MIDLVARTRIIHWGVFIAIAAIVAFLRLLPVNPGDGQFPGPDWIVLFGFAWALRRPDYIPALLFAGIVFLEDIMFQRPPGLWAAISLLGLEFLRARAQFSRELPFLIEWAMIAGVLLLMVLANRLLLSIFLLPRPPAMIDGVIFIVSILAYPLAVLISAVFLGVRKIAPGEVDVLGHRI